MLLQLRFDRYNVLIERKLIVFLRGLFCSHTLIGPPSTVFDGCGR